MARRAANDRRLSLLWAPLALCTGACSGLGTTPTPAPTSSARPAPATAVRSPESPPSRNGALEARIDELELRLLEAQAQQLDVQARLEDARREVVRALAKLQSAASRADAASGIAETEIALRALPPTAAGQGAEGQRLLAQASAEFDKQNYEGALYLANEAKNAAVAARAQLARAEQESVGPQERSFAVPLPLMTTASANVRDGPGLSYAVLFVLPNGAALTGQSVTQQWLRVTDESGRRGWISQSLIRARP